MDYMMYITLIVTTPCIIYTLTYDVNIFMQMRRKFYSTYTWSYSKKETQELMFRTKFGIVNLFHFCGNEMHVGFISGMLYRFKFHKTGILLNANICERIQTTQYPSQLAINYSKCSTYSSPKWKQNDIYWVNIWTHFFPLFCPRSFYALGVLYVIFFTAIQMGISFIRLISG